MTQGLMMDAVIIRSQAATIRQQAAELEALRADAERYRWLRSQSNVDDSFSVVRSIYWRGAGDCDPRFFDLPEELDAAIDAARKA